MAIQEYPIWKLINETGWGHINRVLAWDYNPYRLITGNNFLSDYAVKYPELTGFIAAQWGLAEHEAESVVIAFCNNEHCYAEVFTHMQMTDPLDFFTQITSTRHLINRNVDLFEMKRGRYSERTMVFNEKITQQLGEAWVRRILHGEVKAQVEQFIEPYGLYRNEFDTLQSNYNVYRKRTTALGILQVDGNFYTPFPHTTHQDYYASMFEYALLTRRKKLGTTETIRDLETNWRQDPYVKLELGEDAWEAHNPWGERNRGDSPFMRREKIDWTVTLRHAKNTPCIWARRYVDNVLENSSLIVCDITDPRKNIGDTIDHSKDLVQRAWADRMGNYLLSKRGDDDVTDAAKNYRWEHFGRHGYVIQLRGNVTIEFMTGFTVDGTPDKTIFMDEPAVSAAILADALH